MSDGEVLGQAVLSHHGSRSILLCFLSRAGYEAAVWIGSASPTALFPLVLTVGECIMISCRVRLRPFTHYPLSILRYSLSFWRGSGFYEATGSGTAVICHSLLSLETAVISLSF